jgi:diguanylate cyclase (GGDEF)-like protein
MSACRPSRALTAEARRPADLAARYGGEEFVILLPNTDAAGCTVVGEKIRAALRQLRIPHALNIPSKRVTVSLGGATIRPHADESIESSSLVRTADQALYAAKESGRDRLIVTDQTTAQLDARIPL